METEREIFTGKGKSVSVFSIHIVIPVSQEAAFCQQADQCYFDDLNHVAFSLQVRWMLVDGVLSLDYGNGYPLLEIYDVYIYGDELTGILYVDGVRDGPVTLYRY